MKKLFGFAPTEENAPSEIPRIAPFKRKEKSERQLAKLDDQSKVEAGLESQLMKYWQEEMKSSGDDEHAQSKLMLIMSIHKELKKCTTLQMVLKKLVTTDEQTRKNVLKVMERIANSEQEQRLFVTSPRSQIFSITIQTSEKVGRAVTRPAAGRNAETPTASQKVPLPPLAQVLLPPPPPPPPPFLKDPSEPPSLPADKSKRTISVRVQQKKSNGWLAETLGTEELSPEEKKHLEVLFEEKPTAVLLLRKSSPQAAIKETSVKVDIHLELLLKAIMKKSGLPITDVLSLLEQNNIDDKQMMKMLNAAWPNAENCERLVQMKEDQLTSPLDRMRWDMAKRVHLKKKLELLLMLESKPEMIAAVKKDLNTWEKIIDWTTHEVFSQILLKLLQWVNFLNKGSRVEEVGQISLREVVDVLGRKSTDNEQSTTIGQLLVETLGLKSDVLQEILDNLKKLEDSEELKAIGDTVETAADDVAMLEETLAQDVTLQEKKKGVIQKMKSDLSQVKKMLEQLRNKATTIRSFYGEEEKTPIAEIIKQQIAILLKGLESLSKSKLCEASSNRGSRTPRRMVFLY